MTYSYISLIYLLCTQLIFNLLFWNTLYLQKSCKKIPPCLLTFLPNFSMLAFYISILPFFISLSPSSHYTLFFWNILSHNHVVYFPLNILQCIFLNILYNHNIIIKIRKLPVTFYLIYRLYANINNCSINSHYCTRENKCLFVRTGVQFRIKDFTYFFALVS